MAVQPVAPQQQGGGIRGLLRNLVGARRANGNQAGNAANVQIQSYLNPGAWTGGRTGFGLVSGREVYACSLEPHPDGAAARVRGEQVESIRGPVADLRGSLIRTNKLDRTKPAQRFLMDGDAQFPGLYVFGRYEADAGFAGFTAANDLLVFVPDMHMNLFRQMPIDSFSRTNAQFPGRRDSQVAQMVTFLDFIDNFAQNTGHQVTVIQLGDLVDVWHAQSVFLQAHNFLHRKAQEYQTAHGAAMTTFDYYYNQNNMLLFEQQTPGAQLRTVTLANWPANANAFDAWALMCLANNFHRLPHTKPTNRPMPLPMHLLNVAINYTQRTAIENTIMSNAVYPEMTNGRNRWAQLSANWIRGNHDMDSDHPFVGGGAIQGGWNGATDRYQFKLSDDYWTVHPVQQDRGKWNLRDDKLCTLLANGPTGYGSVTGLQDCVWYEHGHAFDSYNHRRTWYREDKRPVKKDLRVRYMRPAIVGGFMCTLNFVIDACKYYIERGGAFFELSEWLGDLGLEFYSYDRSHRIFTRYGAAAPNGGQGPIHLVVLGHTHVPHLEDYAHWHGKWVAVDTPWLTG